MEHKFIYTQKLSQTLQLSQTMKNSLDILKMSKQDLLEYIKALAERNPVIEYTPSADMHQLLQETVSMKKTLKDDLYMQLHTCRSAFDETICRYLIESLDENGFLTASVHEYAQLLQTQETVIQKSLQLLQSFEPCGVAAESCRDSIRVQLLRKGKHAAEKIFTQYAKEIIHKDYKAIAAACHLSLEQVYDCLKEIQECQPYPCSSYGAECPPPALPDFEIQAQDGEIEIIPKQLGHFQIEDELLVMKEEMKELREYFDEAYYFIDHLHKRNRTLLMMVNELVHIQRNHFLYMDELQPCTLMDIAKKTGFHESTVSRTLSNKYYVFQNEIYAVKDLFVSATKEGSSKDSILKAIQKLVDTEDKRCPYRDQDLVVMLEELDLYVSRRGIAKYRSILHIPGSKERKQK